MNKILYVFILVFSFYSCNTDDQIDLKGSNLVGEWKLSEAYISAGGPQYWVDIENGEEIRFFRNGTFISDRFKECSTGFFSIKKEELVLTYSCSEFHPITENEEGFITYKLELSSNYFILTPTSGPICIEGCSYKYRKE